MFTNPELFYMTLLSSVQSFFRFRLTAFEVKLDQLKSETLWELSLQAQINLFRLTFIRYFIFFCLYKQSTTILIGSLVDVIKSNVGWIGDGLARARDINIVVVACFEDIFVLGILHNFL